ncbi:MULTISPECIES: zinc ribbon domain-containing protein [unclassified Streptomyces]|uniref:zinc ribbon domain-containing protein n=1 Tax=unclassified Streptomyces TaxID=2593676 RepID=UPI002E363E97|nr:MULTISPECIES: zinc ribbon domain-containing protein [unclassified Streptomyces]WUC64900.1 zinc ribbon domain-containing protein [Streptomyces sp. NBC_00539]
MTAVRATFSAGTVQLHRGPLGPRSTDRKGGPKYLASGFLRCGADLVAGGTCGRPMSGRSTTRSRKSPYNYVCNGAAGRGCGRCAISGPLVDDAIERLLFTEGGQGGVRLPDPMRLRWLYGEMAFDEKRRVVASVFDCLVIKPGRKGNHVWDYARVVPVWKWADRLRTPVVVA